MTMDVVASSISEFSYTRDSSLETFRLWGPNLFEILGPQSLKPDPLPH